MYEINFKIENDRNNDCNGFCNVLTEGCFEPGWSINLLFHDIFEHFFEFSKYYSTETLSQAGECVAMGIRQWFYEHTGLVQNYASYNKYQGVEWNSFETCLGQINDAVFYENDTYSLDFNFKHLKKWNRENTFEGRCSDYKHYKIEKYFEKVELAMSYGYWLAEYLFDDLTWEINNFCSNLMIFLKACEFPTDMLDTFDIDNLRSFKVKVSKKGIVGRFNNGVYVSDKLDVNKSINLWNKKNDLIW